MASTSFDNPVPSFRRAAPLGPVRRLRPRSPAVLLAMLLLATAVVTIAPTRTSAASAAATASAQGSGSATIVLTGRGWGHGRGMGQYGALGYAVDHGWTSAQILDHFYGGTTAGPAPSPGEVDGTRLRVDLVNLKGRPTTVALADGTLHLMASDGSTLTRVTGAVRLTPFAAGDGFGLLTGPSCDGPWTAAPGVAGTLVRIEAETTAAAPDGLLQACGPSYRTWYDGELHALIEPDRSSVVAHTLNMVSVEEYLRGVVPNEVPASWPDAALQAQAVAARSYVLAGDVRRGDWADTCDSTACQVYDGRYTNRRGSFQPATHTRTDAAISATAGLVRLTGGGAVARTEFSSSTGGWTAGGDFPAVADDGDATPANPNHRWRVEVSTSPLESAYGLGALTGMAVVSRTGEGPDGGRVRMVELRFADGTIQIDGDTVRRKLGLKSNWFSVGPLTRGGVVQEPIDPELITRYVDRAYRRVEGRAPTSDELAFWVETVGDGSRADLAWALVHGPRYSGLLVDDLYQRALGRGAEAGGRSYWVAQMTDGLAYEQLGTLFYGSPEYLNRSGGTHATMVDALYEDILGRSSDADGRRYWVDQLDLGRATTADVANAFYRSIESRRGRARATHLRIEGTAPGASTVERSAERLLAIDDLALAIDLAVDLDLEDP